MGTCVSLSLGWVYTWTPWLYFSLLPLSDDITLVYFRFTLWCLSILLSVSVFLHLKCILLTWILINNEGKECFFFCCVFFPHSAEVEHFEKLIHFLTDVGGAIHFTTQSNGIISHHASVMISLTLTQPCCPHWVETLFQVSWLRNWKLVNSEINTEEKLSCFMIKDTSSQWTFFKSRI